MAALHVKSREQVDISFLVLAILASYLSITYWFKMSPERLVLVRSLAQLVIFFSQMGSPWERVSHRLICDPTGFALGRTFVTSCRCVAASCSPRREK